MSYSYDRMAGRVTFGRFGRPDEAGGGPADIFLDGVYVGEIERETEMETVGVMARKYKILSYTASISGPIGFSPEAERLFEEKEYESLPELKRLLTSFLSKLPEGVSEAYRDYAAKKIDVAERVERVKALL